MKTKLSLLTLTASFGFFLCGSAKLLAQDVTLTNSASNPPSHWYDSSSDLYQPYDVSVEAFAVGTATDRGYDHGDYRFRHHLHGGGGAGLEFFFNRYIGIEGEGIAVDDTRNFVDSAGGNLVLRLPIGETGLAPYIFGGGGHQFNPVDCVYGDGGAGLEYRFTRCFGVFADGRFVVPDHVRDYGEARLGVKFTF